MNTKRNLGLDIVRSIAIILVMISHSRMFFSADLQFISICGLLGVEIFFVLSGFLIGKILIKDFVEIDFKPSLKKFYLRRWLRTLPLYYLVLVLIAIINKQTVPLTNLFFLQNFNETDLNFMAVSWSLSVEEWFYLIVPLILFIALKFFSKKVSRKNIFFIVSITIALMSFVYRIYGVYKYNAVWDYGVRKQVFYRMDAMMVGVLLAGLKHYYISIYNKIAKTKLPPFISIIGFATIGTWYIGYLGAGATFESKLAKIFIFSLIPLVCMFFIVWLESSVKVNEHLVKHKISKIIVEISILSYPLYLVHYTVYLKLARQQGFKGLTYAVILSFMISILLHYIFEEPIMKWRDKITLKIK